MSVMCVTKVLLFDTFFRLTICVLVRVLRRASAKVQVVAAWGKHRGRNSFVRKRAAHERTSAIHESGRRSLQPWVVRELLQQSAYQNEVIANVSCLELWKRSAELCPSIIFPGEPRGFLSRSESSHGPGLDRTQEICVLRPRFDL